MPQLRLLLLAGLACLCFSPAAPRAFGQDAPPDLELTAYAFPTTGELYNLMTFAVQIDPALYTNPFDPADIELVGVFTPPSGQQQIAPGFWMQPYEDRCAQPCQVEDLQPAGNPVWQVRFAPREPGDWSYILQVRDDGSLVSSYQGTFAVTPSERRGFIRVAANGHYFRFDSGQPYFPIGHNLNWSWTQGGGLYAYEQWLRALSEAGGNYARLYIDVPWFIGLEWDTAGDYTQAQDDAARLDAILGMADEYGVYLQLVVLWHQALQTYTGPPVLVPQTPPRPDTSADWDDNPYNVVNGGTLNGVSPFFFDPNAQALFRRRLRYIVARWGYSPHIFAWEVIDEIDRTATSNADALDAWLQDMAGYLKQIDPARHLVTAGSRELNPALASNPLLDFTQGRFYQRLPLESTGEQEAGVLDVIRRSLRLNRRPTLVTGFSLNPWYEPTESDPEGVHVQNTLWVAALSGSAGGAASAWGDTYVMPQGLTRYYAPLAAFASGVDWANLNLLPAEAGLLTDAADAYTPVRLSDFRREFRVSGDETAVYTIMADGVSPSLQEVPSFLYGQLYNSQLHEPQTYQVTVPVDTYLEVAVTAASTQGDANLVVTIDDQTEAELHLEPGARDVGVRVPLPGGEHSISLLNTGEDWLELDYIEIGALGASARVLTLRDSNAGVALAWLQHRAYTWDQVAAGAPREPLPFRYRLDGMPPGRYLAEIWNPLTGAVLGEEVLRVAGDGVLLFDLLPFDSQLAIRAFLQPETAPPLAEAAEPPAAP